MSLLRRSAPAVLGIALFALFFGWILDPRLQLYYRDTGRLYYPVKLYIAEQLRAGHLALWDRYTEAGVSLLGQMTPGVLHPATLLYLIFPFDLAFKLNHLLGPLLGGIGAWFLARRLGVGQWSRLAAAVTYAGCGYLVSVTGSNLPFSLGSGSVPLAVDGVLGFVERRTLGRFAWAGCAVALVGLSGDPQSMLIAGVISGGWAVLDGGSLRGALRNVGLVAAAGGLALLLAAPAVLPAVVELRRSNRSGPLSAKERSAFANHPARLLGLLVPRAFDDAPEAQEGPATSWGTYAEFLAVGSDAAFADSILIGAPALLFALCAAFAGRRGRLLLAGAILFALASTGEALGIDRVLFAAVPFSGIFRYAEKLMAPASLLFALACAVGADRALSGSRRAAGALGAVAAVLALIAVAASFRIAPQMDDLAQQLVASGTTHRLRYSLEFLRELVAGLRDVAALSAVVAAVAAWRAARLRDMLVLAPVCCAASAFASCGALLYTGPVQYLRGPFPLAQELEARAGGPSTDRWRAFINTGRPPAHFADIPPRVGAVVGLAESLFPQFDSVAHIEGISFYFSAADSLYLHALGAQPEKFFDVFGVRFAVEMPLSFSEATAKEKDFQQVRFGYWVREYPVRSRAFVVQEAQRMADTGAALDRIAAADFIPRRDAVLVDPAAPARIAGIPSNAALRRPSPEKMLVRARGPGLLVVGEHYDPGWRAFVDGRRSPVFQADLTALSVELSEGVHEVEFRYWPVGFLPGVGALLAACGALGIAAAARRRR